MPTTPNIGLRYPAASDAPDGPGGLYNLATDVEKHLGSTWNTYTPGYQNINLTFTTSRWRYRADRVLVRLDATVSSNSGNGGVFLISTPSGNDAVGTLVNGRAVMYRGSNRYALQPENYSAGLVQFFYGSNESPVTTASPATWAANDKFFALFEYDTSA